MKCRACEQGSHEECTVQVATGYTVPARAGERMQMVPEMQPCSCGCQNVEVPW